MRVSVNRSVTLEYKATYMVQGPCAELQKVLRGIGTLLTEGTRFNPKQTKQDLKNAGTRALTDVFVNEFTSML